MSNGENSDSDSVADSEPVKPPTKSGDDNSLEARTQRSIDKENWGDEDLSELLDEPEGVLRMKDRSFDFPIDKENWREEDLRELWADAPVGMTKPGWDPAWVDEEDIEVVKKQVKAGRDPPIAPFYLPYRRPYPVVPTKPEEVTTAKGVIEELDKTEEFLRWVSYIFPDGSSYEGTVWDDLAHGKGVYVAEQGLVRYEGEWLQNNMEGHGVVEVDIPDIEPVPGSKLEAEMRAEGKIIKRDFMMPEDREWLEMDIKDSMNLTDGNYEIPFYENDEWIRQYGRKPEKGRYRYAGQWKHSRMHGCGVYEVNERTIYGHFYFGELLGDSSDCDEETCALHAGIAEVAAAKARMFVNKPDGMVREERGPYSDPQHHYFYEEEDVWQAPGFINQFYEVPDYWKTYVHEVDQEREMWLNSFYKAPLRIPMPAELEYWWEKDDIPEFILVNKEPEPDPEDPSKLIYTEDPLILHTPTGRLINYIEDEEHGLRLFWQPPLEEGEDVDPMKVEFLPLGFDEFYGRVVEKESFWTRLTTAVEKLKPMFDKLREWAEEQRKASEMRLKLIEKELELVEAELCLEEAIEDMEAELKREEKEANKKVEMGLLEEEDVSTPTPAPVEQDENTFPKGQEETSPEGQKEFEEEEEEEEGKDDAPPSFGSVDGDYDTKGSQKGNGLGKSPFSTLSFASSGMISMVPSMVQQSFMSWKRDRLLQKSHAPLCNGTTGNYEAPRMVSFQRVLAPDLRLRIATQANWKIQVRHCCKRKAPQVPSTSQNSSFPSGHMHWKQQRKEPISWRHDWLLARPETYSDIVLSLHIPLHMDSYDG